MRKKKYLSYKKRLGKLRVIIAVILVAAAALLAFLAYKGYFRPQIGEGTCQFHFIDVGQGDCSMFICNGGCTVIDAGPRGCAEDTALYITRYTDTVDYLILTHPDEDHIGGAAALLRLVKVNNIIMSDAAKDTYIFSSLLDAIEDSDAAVIKAVPGAEYSAGDMKLTILAPIGDFYDYNDYSVVTKIEYGKTSAIVTGDAELDSEFQMTATFGDELDADVLKLAHHGSSTSTGEDFFRAVSPKIAIISCGRDNSYGHPHVETLALLSKYGVKYYRTDRDGNIVLISDGKTVGRE